MSNKNRVRLDRVRASQDRGRAANLIAGLKRVRPVTRYVDHRFEPRQAEADAAEIALKIARNWPQASSPALQAMVDRFIGDDPVAIAAYEAALAEDRAEFEQYSRREDDEGVVFDEAVEMTPEQWEMLKARTSEVRP
jgi:hypothetical protein